MDAPLLARQISSSCLSSSMRRLALSDSSRALPANQIRHQSSASRTKRALNIPPHPSFLTSSSSSAAAPTTQSSDHIIFNPPASAPSVYHTPFKFLPKSDPRRRANLNALFSSSTTVRFSDSSSTSPSSAAAADGGAVPELPPRVEHDYYRASRHHLSKEDVAEMRRLRAQDPLAWSVHALAKKYDCSPIFVMMVVQASQEHKDQVRARLNGIRSRWGPKKAQAREDRRKRREMLYNGEI
ncbi:uncharacterized protein E0L32_011884 [Thyridium curvatum]|uniref:Uncharacterized protein n=1 Tax=Thyridium curvatum TaxID=1093900 RepID=A0A507B4L2_9PEZI|nr:uncharacterized protein E0L32_011884 [Thyridium curvatum]TPX18065.1 hypothetical protein E0L32_011884 [Thyridium curvatum]